MSLPGAGRLPAAFDLDIRSAEERACFAPALALALSLAALPFLLLLPVDTDRAAPIILLPAVWLGLRAFALIPRMHVLFPACITATMAVSALLSDHVARSVVMSAAVCLTLAGAIVAGRLARCEAAVRLVLAGIVVGAITGTLMVRLGVASDRMFFPVYWSARLLGAHQFAGCAAALVLLWRTPDGLRLRVLPATAALLTWTGLAWSGSRAPALGLGVIVFAWFWFGSRDERRFLLQWVPALSLLALACSYPLGTAYPQLGWWQAFERTAQAVDVTTITSHRTDYWSASWEQIRRAPWIGSGADAYLYLVPKQPGNQPHCMPLQWLLEYGMLGALPWLALLGFSMRSLRPGLGRKAVARPAHSLWSGSFMAGAAVYGLFDGVFYHTIVFMPVSVMMGFAIGAAEHTPSGHGGEPPTAWASGWLRLPVLVAAALLLVHNWLYLMLLKAPNVTPDSAPARILRVFPSTTYALQNWTERWRRTDPALAMEWIHWAQTVSTNPGSLHVHATQVFLWQKNFDAAEVEMLRCLEKVNPAERAEVKQVIDNIRRWRDEYTAASSSRASSQPEHP